VKAGRPSDAPPGKPRESSRKPSAPAPARSKPSQPGLHRFRGMSDERRQELLRMAHARVEECLGPRLQHIEEEKRPVSEAELERMAVETLGEVERFLLEKLLEFEPWLEEAATMERWECPACGAISPRSHDEAGNPAFDEIELKTTRGPVAFKGPLFYCKTCRCSFSPGAGSV